MFLEGTPPLLGSATPVNLHFILKLYFMNSLFYRDAIKMNGNIVFQVIHSETYEYSRPSRD